MVLFHVRRKLVLLKYHFKNALIFCGQSCTNVLFVMRKELPDIQPWWGISSLTKFSTISERSWSVLVRLSLVLVSPAWDENWTKSLLKLSNFNTCSLVNQDMIGETSVFTDFPSHSMEGKNTFVLIEKYLAFPIEHFGDARFQGIKSSSQECSAFYMPSWMPLEIK